MSAARPPALGAGSAASLIAYYREHGESEYVAAVEEALEDGWATTAEVSERSGCSYNYCRKALEYLAVEGRAERSTKRLRKPYRGVNWKYLWRRSA